jgi:hypothetical protein
MLSPFTNRIYQYHYMSRNEKRTNELLYFIAVYEAKGIPPEESACCLCQWAFFNWGNKRDERKILLH